MNSDQPARVPWNPTHIREVIESYDTSMGTTRVVTDAGDAYLKAMGNRQSPHCLAIEFVATRLADQFGLTVADHAIIDLPDDACFDLPRGVRTQPGPAFLSRHVPGKTWEGSSAELACLVNPTDLTRLVVFDTWVRNCDRYPPDLTTRRPNYGNVYVADTDQPSKKRLLAIDHTHCFDCGRDLSTRLSHLDHIRDERTYGLFPAFMPLIEPGELLWCAATLGTLPAMLARDIVAHVPAVWDVSDSARAALIDLIVKRAAYLAERIERGWMPSNL